MPTRSVAITEVRIVIPLALDPVRTYRLDFFTIGRRRAALDGENAVIW
jgi:hypothetical protein